MDTTENEEELLRSVALQNARTILQARERSEDELRQAKEELEQKTRELELQREWFAVTLSSIGDAVITTDVGGFVTFLNPVAEMMTGWKSNEAVGQPLKTIFNIVNEKTRETAVNPVEEVFRKGVIVGLANHTALIAKNGTETAVEDSAAPIRDSSGKITGAVMVFHDVTERRRLEAVLHTNHDQFSAIINQSPVSIYLVDAELRLRHINAKARPTFGKLQNLIGRDLEEVLHVLWPATVANEQIGIFRHTLKTGESYTRRGFTERRADNSNQEYYDWELHRITLPDGQHGLACYFTDVSEHVLAQQAFMERARLSALRADINIALAKSEDLPSVLQHCAQALVTHLDGAFARVWTLNESLNLLELKASAGIYTHLNGPHARIKMGEFKIGRIAMQRMPLLTNDVATDENISDPEWAKKEGMVAFAGYPLILENQVLGVMAMFAKHPLTNNVLRELAPIADGIAQWVQRRRAEAALLKAQLELKEHAASLEKTVEERTAQLKDKIGELEAFSYSVSHDMRSPLRAMQGYAAALLSAPNLARSEEEKHYLERIHKAATRMDLLVREVLNYSRISKEELNLIPINLEKLIDEVRQSYPALQEPKAHVIVHSPLPLVLGHEALVTQTVSNLLGNAVKFVKPGLTPIINIRSETEARMVRVWVEDNGIGIDPSHFNRVFEIFGRVYGDKKYEGTGIGLAIVKKAVERMGGQIGLESELGKGSRFWFTLKAA